MSFLRTVRRVWSGAAPLMLLLLLALGACASGATDAATPAVDQDSSAGSTVADQYSTLDPITLDELPREAIDTLELIRSEGPYPYRQDGGTFQNREGILPDFPRGHYQEFTVDTPGLSHRGARRFVTGDDGEIYYTEDHYESFRELIPQ